MSDYVLLFIVLISALLGYMLGNLNSWRGR